MFLWFSEAVLRGESVVPFERGEPELNAELLALTPKLLAWKGESLLRFASCVLCRDSKRLEGLSGRLEQILRLLSDGRIRSLEDLGISANPRFVLLHGPLKLQLNGRALDFANLTGPFRLFESDVLGATKIRTTAIRCLTVENETTFHELAKLRSGELLVQTSFPGSATLALLRRLPSHIEFWHFGDTDPEGYGSLSDLRERSGRSFRALHTTCRPQLESVSLNPEERRKIDRLLISPVMRAERKDLESIQMAGRIGQFEQESLGIPSPTWPFYQSGDIR